MNRRRVIVSGRVQGVSFRDVCRRRAVGLGVAGWVRNLPDGTVEALFEGEPRQVERLVSWTRKGPTAAVVTGTEVFDEQPEGLSGFQIRPTPRRPADL